MIRESSGIAPAAGDSGIDLIYAHKSAACWSDKTLSVYGGICRGFRM